MRWLFNILDGEVLGVMAVAVITGLGIRAGVLVVIGAGCVLAFLVLQEGLCIVFVQTGCFVAGVSSIEVASFFAVS